MGRYNANIGQYHQVQVVERIEKTVEKSQEIDFAKLANAVAQALEGKLGNMQIAASLTAHKEHIQKDTFDATKTMESIANSMLVQRGKNEANFDDLGKVNETQKDQDKTNKTIDLLSGLDD